MKSYRGTITESDFLASSVYHSLTAPYVIKKDFPEFAVPDILSAVRNHTTGSPDMSVFDEIIFIADYVEEGRTYPACIEVRERLFNFILRSQDAEECISFLHDAAIASLDNTIVSLIKRGDFLHEKTVMTRNAFLGRKPLALN